jgi:hypothetical protein
MGSCCGGARIEVRLASQARIKFNDNCDDINRLLGIHEGLTGTAPGRRYGTEVLNKSGIVLLTAFWEAFCEDVAAEALSHLVEHAPSAQALPTELRKLVAKELKNHKNDLEIWRLSGEGWRQVLTRRLVALQQERNMTLNTPKAKYLDRLFYDALGIETISGSWTWRNMPKTRASAKLDYYVTLRGAIAHRGAAASTVKKRHLEGYFKHAKHLVELTETRVAEVVWKATGVEPWTVDQPEVPSPSRT